jgi:hypothetical protein
MPDIPHHKPQPGPGELPAESMLVDVPRLVTA